MGDLLSIGSRLTKKPKKQKPAPTYVPNGCVLLCVDPAANSGWAIYDHGELVDFGECDLYSDEPRKLLERAKGMGVAVLVIERPFSVRFGTQVAVGGADLNWRTHAKRLGYAKRIVRVYPASWRAKAMPGWGKRKRDEVREHEQEVARALTDARFTAQPGPDACPAILIGKWATHAGEVALVLPKERAPRTARAAKAVGNLV